MRRVGRYSRERDWAGGLVVLTGSPRLLFAGSLASIVGGLFWAMKATSLMVAGVQPPVVYEVAPMFFPVVVIGLYSLLEGTRSRLARAGLTLAGIAELCALGSVLGLYLGPAEWTPSGDSVTVLTPFITMSALGSIGGTLLVGMMVRRTDSLPGRWRSYPMVLALSVIPLIASSAIFQALHRRLFELPTLVIGLEWIVLGVVMARHRDFRRAGPSA